MATTQNTTEINLKVHLSQHARKSLLEQAARTGQGLNDLASELLEHAAATSANDAVQPLKPQTPAQFDQLLEEFFAANPEKLPALPADFSRADIYADHD